MAMVLEARNFPQVPDAVQQYLNACDLVVAPLQSQGCGMINLLRL
jgi:hypothetical protein